MIVVDRDIKRLLLEGTIVVISGDPTRPFDPDSQIGPGSIDLRVNNVFRRYKPSVEIIDSCDQNGCL
jgi:deoxycytidine triphosphate deaminase